MDDNKTVRVDNPQVNPSGQVPTFNQAQFQPNNQMQFNQQVGMNQMQYNQQPGMNQMPYNQQMSGFQANNGGDVYPSDLQMSLQNTKKDEPKKNNTPLIVGITAAVTALLVGGIALILHKPDKKNEKTTEVTTEAVASNTDGTTEAVTTEAGTTEVAQAPTGYQVPTALGTSWKEYNFSLGGTLYSLPIPYAAILQMGWKVEDPPTSVSAGNFDYVKAYAPDGAEVRIILGNPNISSAPLEQCYVLGIVVDTEDYQFNSEFTLPGNISVDKSTIDDIKAAYGTPDDYTAFDGGYEITYVGDNIDDGLDMYCNKDGILYNVTYLRAEVKDALDQNASNVSDNVPSMNADYVAPTGPSKSEIDGILSIDGAYYKLPVPVSEFLKNGWELDIMSDEVIYGNNYTSTYLTKGDAKLSVTIDNYTDDAILTKNGIVSNIVCYDYFCENIEVVYPGGVTFNTTDQEILNMFSKYEEFYYPEELKDYNVFTCYMDIGEEEYDYLQYVADYWTGNNKITDLGYSINGFESYK